MNSPSSIFLESQLNDLCEKGFTVIDNFLPASLIDSLENLFFSKKELFHKAQVGKGLDPASPLVTVRSDETLWLDSSLQDPIASKALDWIQQSQVQLSESLRIFLSDFEFHLAEYPPGGFYKAHIDQFKQHHSFDKLRVISQVIYFNRNWKPEHGGSLILHAGGPIKSSIKVEPLWNRTILFLSDSVLHEVEMSSQVRRSLTGWYRK